MGITCKGFGKFRGMMRKIENENLENKEKEKIASRKKSKSNSK